MDKQLRKLIAEALAPSGRDRSGHLPEGVLRNADRVMEVLGDYRRQVREDIAGELESRTREMGFLVADDEYEQGFRDAIKLVRDVA